MAVIPEKGEELFRVYFYYCQPYEGTQTHPLSGEIVDFSNTPEANRTKKFCRDLSGKDYIAFRKGELSFDGWGLDRETVKRLIKEGPRPLTAGDIKPDLKQKRVDIKIGLDVAWLASKRIVDKIILVTGDSDFVPAVKFARREGVQVILVPMGYQMIKHDLIEHMDEIRHVTSP